MTEWTQEQPTAPGEYWALINWVVVKVRVDGATAHDVDGAYYVRDCPIPLDSISYWCKSDTKPKMPKAAWMNA